jgi:hypothetical protein
MHCVALGSASNGTRLSMQVSPCDAKQNTRTISIMTAFPSRRIIAAVAALGSLCLGSASFAQQERHPAHDYPTAARADYVIGCLAANGFKRELLQKCACGIDTIADLMSYDDYEKAATILSMQQGGAGPRAGLFRDTPIAREELRKLRAAEAEVNLRC